MTILILKKCNICGEDKELNEFNKQKNAKDGLYYRCRECSCKLNKEWRIKNYYRDTERSALWKKNNHDKILVRLKNNVKKITTTYIKTFYHKKYGYGLIIPNELIEVKRLQITLVRLIKEHKQNNS